MEQVFAVPRQKLFDGDWPQGFFSLEPDRAAELLEQLAEQGSFVDRPLAEDDPMLKQPIPYCAVQHRGALLCVRRGAKQTESRLHGKLSIGIGGHVNPVDSEDFRPTPGLFYRAMRRELIEELMLPEGLVASHARLVGLINDDSTEVGRVHVGLAFVLDVPAEEPRRNLAIREISSMSGGFRRLAEPADLWQDLSAFETWSSLFLLSHLLSKDWTNNPTPS